MEEDKYEAVSKWYNPGRILTSEEREKMGDIKPQVSMDGLVGMKADELALSENPFDRQHATTEITIKIPINSCLQVELAVEQRYYPYWSKETAKVVLSRKPISKMIIAGEASPIFSDDIPNDLSAEDKDIRISALRDEFIKYYSQPFPRKFDRLLGLTVETREAERARQGEIEKKRLQKIVDHAGQYGMTPSEMDKISRHAEAAALKQLKEWGSLTEEERQEVQRWLYKKRETTPIEKEWDKSWEGCEKYIELMGTINSKTLSFTPSKAFSKRYTIGVDPAKEGEKAITIESILEIKRDLEEFGLYSMGASIDEGSCLPPEKVPFQEFKAPINPFSLSLQSVFGKENRAVGKVVTTLAVGDWGVAYHDSWKGKLPIPIQDSYGDVVGQLTDIWLEAGTDQPTTLKGEIELGLQEAERPKYSMILVDHIFKKLEAIGSPTEIPGVVESDENVEPIIVEEKK